MGRQETLTQIWADSTRRVLLALWAIPGIGRRGIERLATHRELSALGALGAAELPTEGAGAAAAGFLEESGFPSLNAIAEEMLQRCHATKTDVCFPGDPAYPSEIAALDDAPVVLFFRGPGGSAYRRVGVVGTREPGPEYEAVAEHMGFELAARGVTVVSGAADGVDQAAHRGAVKARGETWAFLGSSIDQADPKQRKVVDFLPDRGGTIYSEFPPGVRASKQTFPRRNRLISGCSEATVVVLAGEGSGALHTAEYAQKQGRPVFVVSASPLNERAVGGLELVLKGKAQLVVGASHVLRLIGADALPPRPGQEEVPQATPDLSELSPEARQAYEAMSRRPQRFDEVLAATGVDSGALVSALCELEISGLVLQRPGKLYERI